jgi:hypothetical protein
MQHCKLFQTSSLKHWVFWKLISGSTRIANTAGWSKHSRKKMQVTAQVL